MKMFKAVLSALGAIAVLMLGAVSVTLKPALHYLAEGCHALANGIERFERDLVHMFGAEPASGEGLQSGMRREGHGFRQHSAPKYTGDPMPTA